MNSTVRRDLLASFVVAILQFGTLCLVSAAILIVLVALINH